MNDEDWDFNAPQHYIDLPSAALQSDDEHVDEYFFGMFMWALHFYCCSFF